jgi:hypothetical protein
VSLVVSLLRKGYTSARTPGVRRCACVSEQLERGQKEQDKEESMLGTPQGQLEEASGALAREETLYKKIWCMRLASFSLFLQILKTRRCTVAREFGRPEREG